MPLWAHVLTKTSLIVAAVILATFFYQPTLDVYTGWANHIMGVSR